MEFISDRSCRCCNTHAIEIRDGGQREGKPQKRESCSGRSHSGSIPVVGSALGVWTFVASPRVTASSGHALVASRFACRPVRDILSRLEVLLKHGRILAFLICFAAVATAQQSSITPGSLRTWLTYLASD